MDQLTQLLLVFVVFLNLYLLGSSSLTGCVNIVAVQGICLGLLPLGLHEHGVLWRTVALSAGMIAVKGVLIPRVLLHAIREVRIRREVEPLVGFTTSLMIGAVLIGVAFLLSERLPVPAGIRSSLLVPVSLATVMMGMLVMVTRTKALTQVLGYLVFENGIYLFGLAISYEMPWLIEMGVLLDAFVAAFIMGIVIYHIGREFDSISTENLTRLSD
ncbi:MAG: hydrogenase [Elusimicrobia bacterium]|nr:hydrogenase [Elusimicrobiota bacterium]